MGLSGGFDLTTSNTMSECYATELHPQIKERQEEIKRCLIKSMYNKKNSMHLCLVLILY